MEPRRSLWTGPHGASLRDRALSLAIDPRAIWIVPSPLARRQVLERLARRRGVLHDPRVLTWPELWPEIGRDRLDRPALLSDAGRLAALEGATRRASAEGLLRGAPDRYQARGFRRSLLRQFDRWGLQERIPTAEAPPGADAEAWAVYGGYRDLLDRAGATDAPGLASWASRVLESDPSPSWRRLGRVVLIEPDLAARATWRALRAVHQRADFVLATLSGCLEDRPSRALRGRLVELGFEEETFSGADARPAALTGLEATLFRDAPEARGTLTSTDGLSVLGAPSGEGQALVVARRVRELIDGGTPADQVVILVPAWDDQAELFVETLRSWGIPATSERPRMLAAEPAISALVAAARLPIDDWETARLAGLLRNGQLDPDWPEIGGAIGRAEAAMALRESSEHRDLQALRRALARTMALLDSADGRGDPGRVARSALALNALDRLEPLFRGVGRPAPWSDQAARLDDIARALGIGGAGARACDRAAVEALFVSIDEVDAVDRRAGAPPRPISWAEFLARVEELRHVVAVTERVGRMPRVVVATAGSARGLRARQVILANLGEGTFPSLDVLAPGAADADAEGDSARSAAEDRLAREMERFLEVLGSAERGLTLVYPTKDASGVPLNVAGFLEDVRRRFEPSAWEGASRVLPRLMPVLDADLAGSPREMRVRAVGLAIGDPGAAGFGPLRGLARRASHRGALAGAAAALRVAHHRQGRRHYGPFDGMLHDREVVRRIAEQFGSDRPAFSASQLESLALCPFQFFLRYVLRLDPRTERGEFDEDRAWRGSIAHEALELLHEQLRDAPEGPEGGSLADLVAARVGEVMARVIDSHEEPRTEVGRGLRHIEALMLASVGRRYSRQFAEYAADIPPAEFAHCEVGFGPSGNSKHPSLVIGDGADAVRLQGQIDRIDLIRTGDATYFRVIDYKTGTPPGRNDVRRGLALQLPLYALAAERVILAESGTRPLSAGYWGLKEAGFKNLVAMEKVEKGALVSDPKWPVLRENLERFVIGLVRSLRLASLPIHPRKADCTSHCDYNTVCRIGSARSVGKVWAEAPEMEPEG